MQQNFLCLFYFQMDIHRSTKHVPPSLPSHCPEFRARQCNVKKYILAPKLDIRFVVCVCVCVRCSSIGTYNFRPLHCILEYICCCEIDTRRHISQFSNAHTLNYLRSILNDVCRLRGTHFLSMALCIFFFSSLRLYALSRLYFFV